MAFVSQLPRPVMAMDSPLGFTQAPGGTLGNEQDILLLRQQQAQQAAMQQQALRQAQAQQAAAMAAQQLVARHREPTQAERGMVAQAEQRQSLPGDGDLRARGMLGGAHPDLAQSPQREGGPAMGRDLWMNAPLGFQQQQGVLGNVERPGSAATGAPGPVPGAAGVSPAGAGPILGNIERPPMHTPAGTAGGDPILGGGPSPMMSPTQTQPAADTSRVSTISAKLEGLTQDPLFLMGMNILANNHSGKSTAQVLGEAGLNTMQQTAFLRKKDEVDELKALQTKQIRGRIDQEEKLVGATKTLTDMIESFIVGDREPSEKWNPDTRRIDYLPGNDAPTLDQMRIAALRYQAEGGNDPNLLRMAGLGEQEGPKIIGREVDDGPGGTGKTILYLDDGSSRYAEGPGLTPEPVRAEKGREPTQHERNVAFWRDRQGLSEVNAEAAASGRVVVTTDEFGVTTGRNQNTGEVLWTSGPGQGGAGQSNPGAGQGGGSGYVPVTVDDMSPNLGGQADPSASILATDARPAPGAQGSEPTGPYAAIEDGTGFWSAARDAANSVAGQLPFVNSDLAPDTTAARQELGVWAQSMMEALRLNNVISVTEQGELRKLLPSPNDWAVSPAAARTKMETLDKWLAKKSAELRASAASGRIPTKEANENLVMAEEVDRQRRLMGNPGSPPDISSMNAEQLRQLKGSRKLTPEEGEAAFLRYQELQRNGGRQ